MIDGSNGKVNKDLIYKVDLETWPMNWISVIEEEPCWKKDIYWKIFFFIAGNIFKVHMIYYLLFDNIQKWLITVGLNELSQLNWT